MQIVNGMILNPMLNPEAGKPITAQSQYLPSRISELGMNEIARRKAKEMNVLNTTRVGWEQKQKYIDWLAQMSAEGYLTEEEYNARMEWLQTSRTDEEIKLAFSDLPRLRPTGMEPANPKLRAVVPLQHPRRKQAATCLVFQLILAAVAGIAGNIFLLLFFLAFAVLWGTVLVYRMHDESSGR
jgi:hypothetical protein